MGVLRLYDRKSRLGAESLTSAEGSQTDRDYGVICGDDDDTNENDTRRLTAMIFLSSSDWNASTCGGGVTFQNGEEKTDAVRDRIVLFRSDTSYHRQEPWMGQDVEGLDQASCLLVHFVKETK